ncbi:YcxB family protein [Paractinoplanes globisporus]|uniref:YcxB family protein n=1 Tax=Paractinoplanes globisporus TaxID=113565 RepID=A0ABW6WQ48_9ACTN|nr:YcxB family protein [Actinoplanes globisporus]
MFFRITARPDARLVASAVRRGLRPLLLTARGIGWAAIALALLLEVFTTGGPYLTLLLAGALIAVGIPMFLVNTGTRDALRDGDLTTYEISDGGVASSSLAARHAYGWNAFRSVEEAPGQLIFGRSRTRFLPVPTAGLSRDQVDQVLGAAAGHGLRVRRA